MAPTKEGLIRKVYRNLAKLHNDFNVPLFFCYYSKLGIVPFGSEKLVEKFKEDLKTEVNGDENTWSEIFEEDQDAINLGARLDEEDYFTQAQGNCLPPRLPADIDLMVLNELGPIVTKEILKWYWKQGGKWKSIHFGHPDFKADFWPDTWPWENVKKSFANLKKGDFTGPGNITEFLKTVLKNIFESYHIDPIDYVSNEFTDRRRKNRERHRGIHRVAPIEVLDNAAYNYNDDQDGLQQDENDIETEGNESGGNGHETSFQDGNENVEVDGNESVHDGQAENVAQNINEEVTCEDVSDVSDVSNILQEDLIDQIEQVVGEMPDSVFNASVTDTDQVMTRQRSERAESIQSSPKRPRVVPGPSVPSFSPSISSTMPSSSNPSSFQPLRKGPSALNRIPCKEPRRIHIRNEAPPIRNVGMCSTPPRVIRGRRNGSQNVASSSSLQQLAQPIKMKIACDLVDAFKNLSNDNSAASKETGALLAGRKVGEEFVMDTLFIPHQIGHSDRFETVDETDTFNFFNDNPGLLLLGIIHTHPGFESFLSSVDLHMLYNYACSNSSVVSLVLAPELNTCPAYVLTKKGMDTLRFCFKSGFHRHK